MNTTESVFFMGDILLEKSKWRNGGAFPINTTESVFFMGGIQLEKDKSSHEMCKNHCIHRRIYSINACERPRKSGIFP